jgi:hypothetical protein
MARQYNKILGIIFILLGILGFVPGITSNNLLLGIFMVDPPHNLVHLLSGLVLFFVGTRGTEAGARNVALLFGIIYGALTIYGLMSGGVILGGLMMFNMPDNILHLVISVTALGVGLSRESKIPTH